MKNKYMIDYQTKTIFITKEFADAAQTLGTNEFGIMKKLRGEFPNYDIVKRTRKPNKCANKNKNLSYANMEKYIALREGAGSINLSNLRKLINASSIQESRYSYVAEWFKANYGDYKSPFVLVASSEVINHGEIVNRETGEIVPIDELDKIEKKSAS